MENPSDSFSATLERWYALNKRDLPWRETRDPYCIWVSEIILQQTRVIQGYDYYLRFVTAFPTVDALAAASEEKVLRMWQGLGYYTRARNLWAAARTVVADYGGVFPSDYRDVRSLKGIGDYTAAAICSIAFDQPYAVLDGNVYRVLSRYFAVDTPIDSPAGRLYFKKLADNLLDEKKPGYYNQAIMDFGALQCVPRSPDCPACPLSASCMAYSSGCVEKYPRKERKLKVNDRFLVYFLLCKYGKFYVHRRSADDIWAGLFEPYLTEFAQKPSSQEVFQKIESGFGNGVSKVRVLVESKKHVLTHRRLWISAYQIEVKAEFDLPGFELLDKKGIGQCPMPKPVVDLFKMV